MSIARKRFTLSNVEVRELHRILHRPSNVRSPPQFGRSQMLRLPVAETIKLHRILHRPPASAAYCGLLAVFGGSMEVIGAKGKSWSISNL